MKGEVIETRGSRNLRFVLLPQVADNMSRGAARQMSARNDSMIESICFHKYPLVGFDAMSAATLRSFPRHTHDQYGIGVIDAGGHASLSDTGQVEAGVGNLIFVNPGEVHDGHALGGRSRSWRMLYFDPAVMERTQVDILENAQRTFFFKAPVIADQILRQLFNIAFGYANGRADFRDSMACETAMLQLSARLTVNLSSQATKMTTSTASIRWARERIDADPSAPVTLADLAEELCISRYQLLRAFARELGLTPHAYILQQRIGLARRLIRAGSSLTEAAMAAGFCDQSHLTRNFVRQFGITPARYSAIC